MGLILEMEKRPSKLSLVREALEDWHKGKLSEYSCLIAIDIVAGKKRKPTAEEIAYGKTLTDDYLKNENP